MKIEDVVEIEKQAELNDGKCDHCHQTIKIYRYKINKPCALFLRAMAEEVKKTGVNDVDVSTLGLAYSIRSQATKMRMHGLIARIKNDEGSQVPSHWLITHKGWKFLNHEPIQSKIVVYNNQVLGHEGEMINIYEVLGERFNADEPLYEETPVSEAEARVYDDVRKPKQFLEQTAIYKGRGIKEWTGKEIQLQIQKLTVGQPVLVTAMGQQIKYADIAAFQKDWRAV